MRYTALMSGCAALALAACTDSYHQQAQIGATPALITTADLRVITDRPVPTDTTGARRAVCTEPSPDVAKALSTAVSLSASATVPSGVNGQASLSNQTAEQLAELSGRIPGVVALRDGTFRLCEAWTNGALGDSGYALALSRYGDSLVTLMLGDAVAAAARAAPAKLTATLAAGAGDGTSAGGKGGAVSPTQPSAPPAAGPAKAMAQASAAPAATPIQLASLTLQPLLATTVVPAGNPPPAGNPAAGSHVAGSPVATPPSAQGTSPSGGSAANPAGSTSGSDTGTVAAAQALEQMQRNYLTLGGAGPLLVACIAAGDQTAPNWKPNRVLTKSICRTFLANYAAAIVGMAANASSKPPTPTPASAVSALRK